MSNLSREIIQFEREAVVKEALTWTGTPFQDRQRIKKIGVDCMYLLLEVYGDIEPSVKGIVIPHYDADGFMHRTDGEEPYKKGLEQYCNNLGKIRPTPGDILSFRWGRWEVAHCGIVISCPWFLSPYAVRGRVDQDRYTDLGWLERWTGVWRPFRWCE